MNQEENKAKWNHNLNGYNPSGLTPNKTLLEHIQDLEKAVEEIEKRTSDTKVYIKNILQERLDFESDPQSEIDMLQTITDTLNDGYNSLVQEDINIKKSVAENVKGIAHMNEIKQDKLTQAQIQAIGEIDAIKGIALANQSNVTELASKVENNTNKIDSASDYIPKNTKYNLEVYANIYLLNLGGLAGSKANFYRKSNNELLYTTPDRTTGIIIFMGIGDYTTVISFDSNDGSKVFTFTSYSGIIIEPLDKTVIRKLL